jgi:hypothetical protein
MNAKMIGGSVWLLMIGAASVLLIGAFARFDVSAQADGTAAAASVSPPESASPGDSAPAPAPAPAVASAGVRMLPLDLSPGLAEIIKLAQAQIGSDTILAYIQNSGRAYNPTADEILYLTDLGVSDKVVAALVNKTNPALATAPSDAPENMIDASAPPAPSAAAVDLSLPDGQAPLQSPASYASYPASEPPPSVADEPPPLENPQDSYFYDSLSPYGNWVQTPANGWGWQPMAAAVDTGWMPYRDRGQWMLTDDGWYWASDYSWGWAAFHYGRWVFEPPFGWVWVPGNDWAPAWVAWITTEGFAGWAPLPPGVHYRRGAGLFSAAGAGSQKAGYGLKAGSFTFVAPQHFLSRNVGRYAAPASKAEALFAAGTPVNNYSFAGGRIINVGVTADQIAAATKAPVPKFTLKEASTPETAGGKSAGASLAVFRPDVAAPAARSSAEPATRAVFINKTPRPAATDAAMSRASSPASVSSGYSVQSPRPNSAASRSIIVGGNVAASQTAWATPSTPAPAAGSQAPKGGGDYRRVETPSTPAPGGGYPSYNPRGFNAAPSTPPVSTGTGVLREAPQHNNNVASVGGASPAGAPASAPVESRGGGGALGGRAAAPAGSSSSTPASAPQGSSQSQPQGSTKASR